jgi:serine/threonine-protein kinase RsbW
MPESAFISTPELVRFDLTVPMRDEAELVAARAVEQVAENMAFDTRSIGQIRLALIEACLNAFEHSGSDDRNVYINFVMQEDRLLIIVRDFGRGFDPLEVPEPVIQNKLSSMGNRRGWGLMLIRKLMDEVVYEDASPGTTLRMVKYLPTPPTPAGVPA